MTRDLLQADANYVSLMLNRRRMTLEQLSRITELSDRISCMLSAGSSAKTNFSSIQRMDSSILSCVTNTKSQNSKASSVSLKDACHDMGSKREF